jgi:hypothetical protein
MADEILSVGSAWSKRLKDMGDGTVAEVVSLGGAPVGVAVMNVATNGDRFPSDCSTSYAYDASGVNITSITKTTAQGVSYKQTWTRDAMGQLSVKSGWVKQ